ncbi:MAG: alpha/beta hydrolase [Pseudomonadota bacterium]
MPIAGPSLAKRELTHEMPTNYYERAGVSLLFRPSTFKANARDLTRLKPVVREMSETYEKLRMPIRILTGDADTTVSPTIHSKALARQAPNAKLALYPGVGHFIQHAKSDEVLAALAETSPSP